MFKKSVRHLGFSISGVFCAIAGLTVVQLLVGSGAMAANKTLDLPILNPSQPIICSRSLSQNGKLQQSVATYESMLAKRLTANDSGEGTYRISESVSYPNPEGEKTKAIVAKLEDLQKKMENLDEEFSGAAKIEDEDDIFAKIEALSVERSLLLSDYFSSLGISHTKVQHGFGVELLFIHPSSIHSFARFARQLKGSHGTLLGFTPTDKSFFDPEKNILFLGFESLIHGEPTAKDLKILAKLQEYNVAEYEISNKEQSDIYDVLMKPENAIPGSLRFVNFESVNKNKETLRVRHPFRTGEIARLDDNLKKHLETMLKVHQSKPSQQAVSLGLRSSQGSWVFSMVELGQLNQGIKFNEAIAELKGRFVPRNSISKDKFPDLFMFIAGWSTHSASELRYLQAMANNPNVALNSVSSVLVNSSPKVGGIYTIHTLGLPDGTEQTMMADFLQGTFNYETAVRAAIKNNASLNPFDISE